MCAAGEDLGLGGMSRSRSILARSPEERGAAPRRADRPPSSIRTSSTRTASAACITKPPPASSTPRIRTAGGSSKPVPSSPTISATRRRTSRRVQVFLATPASRIASTTAWCAAWTTTTARCSSGHHAPGRAGHDLRRRRYDGPFEQLGGKPQPAAASAIGNRAPAAGAACGWRGRASGCPTCMVSVGEAARSVFGFRRRRDLLREHRASRVLMHCGGGSSQVADEEGRRQRGRRWRSIGGRGRAAEVGLPPGVVGAQQRGRSTTWSRRWPPLMFPEEDEEV